MRPSDYYRIIRADQWGLAADFRELAIRSQALCIGNDSQTDTVLVSANNLKGRTLRLAVGAPLIGLFEPPIRITPAKTVGAPIASQNNYLHRMEVYAYQALPAVLPRIRAPGRSDPGPYSYGGAGEETVAYIPVYGRKWGTLWLENTAGAAALTWRVFAHFRRDQQVTNLNVDNYEIQPSVALAAGATTSYTWEGGKVDWLELRSTRGIAGQELTWGYEVSDE